MAETYKNARQAVGATYVTVYTCPGALAASPAAAVGTDGVIGSGTLAA